MTTARRATAAVMVAITVAGVILVIPAGTNPHAVPTAAQVEERSMSPFCPGLTIAECPHGRSIELRQEIAEKVEQGWTNAQIDEWLVSDYGEAVLGEPRGPGAWVAPVLAVLAGLGAVFWVTRKKPADETIDEQPQELTDVDRQRLHADLERFRKGYSE